MDDNTKTYLLELVSKFTFIEGVSITDQEGGTLLMHINQKILKSIEDGQNNDEKAPKLNLSFNLTQYLNSSLDQITKIEKWKTKYIISMFDTYTIFQSKYKTFYFHFMCSSKNFNYEIVKEIAKEFEGIVNKIETDIESLNFNNGMADNTD